MKISPNQYQIVICFCKRYFWCLIERITAIYQEL